MRVIGYCRVSTAEQAASGAGIDAQRDAIQAEAIRRGWTVGWIEDRGYSAKDLRRPGVAAALDALAAGKADALVVAKLDRLSRSLLDFAGVMDLASKQAWAVIALDVQVDTTTPAGEAMVNMLATFAQFERRLISQRTKEALAVRRANGVRLGRPRAVPDHVRERIIRERLDGATLCQISGGLNRDGVATVKAGGRWHASTVRSILRQHEATDAANG